jgi:cytochrome c553/cytochrome c5
MIIARRVRALAAHIRRHRRVIAITIATTLGSLAVFAGLVAALGLYNVAASTGHWAIVDHALRFGMERSVKARAPVAAAPSLNDDDLVRLGAAHFELGCAHCHGSPIRPVSPVALGMLPPPPDLGNRVGRWRDSELFWIVKHGIKYAGMPSWPAQARDDEIWAVVAFLRRLPGLDEAGYVGLAFGANAAPGSGDPFARCAACHGGESEPASALVPVLHGQPAARLLAALERYRSGERQSGIMEQAVHDLSPPVLRALAETYAALPAPPPSSARQVDAVLVARGEVLARQGDVSRGVPACLACHAATALPLYPRLAGQPARFLASQLHAFRSGANDRGLGAIMTPIARRLPADDIAAVAAFFAAMARGGAEARGERP